MKVIVEANDGRKVKMTAVQAHAIEVLGDTRKGGCASVVGYKPTTGYVKDGEPTHNIQMITHFSTTRLYERRLAALKAIQYGDVAEDVASNPKFEEYSPLQLVELFNARKGMLMNTLTNYLEDKPKNAHQEGHVRCYALFGDVKVHLETEDVGGIKQPTTNDDGTVNFDSIMVPYLELKKKVIKEGERKPPANSGAAVVMGKYIESRLNSRSVLYKTLSLKENNFEALNVDRLQFLPEDVAKFGNLLDS
jgi:hypothetical protein